MKSVFDSNARILFLDDMRERQESFQRQLVGTGLSSPWCAWDGEQAQKLIAEKDFDVVFLDHDLADDQYAEHKSGIVTVASKALSGTEIADQIAALPKARRPKLAVVHSWNRYGANRMATALHRAGIPVVQIMFNDHLLADVLRHVNR